MTDAELEELVLSATNELSIAAINHGKAQSTRSLGVFRAERKKAEQALISTIRELRAELEKRDRVVEAARAKLAAEDAVNSNIAFGEHDEDAAKAHAKANKELSAALKDAPVFWCTW